MHLRAAEREYEIAIHKSSPHVLYGARVFGKNDKWICIIVYDAKDEEQIAMIIANYGESEISRPYGSGATPKEACVDFDSVWENGR
jgi:hypothetical protein